MSQCIGGQLPCQPFSRFGVWGAHFSNGQYSSMVRYARKWFASLDERRPIGKQQVQGVVWVKPCGEVHNLFQAHILKGVDEQIIHRDCVLVALHRCVAPVDVGEIEVSSDEIHGLLVLLLDAE